MYGIYIALLIITTILFSCVGQPRDEQLVTVFQAEKYQTIDSKLKELQDDLPSDDGEGWIWLSAIREGDTVVYEFQEPYLHEYEFDYQEYKRFIIENIQRNPDLLEDQMKYKMVYFFSDGKVETINISPDDYIVK